MWTSRSVPECGLRRLNAQPSRPIMKRRWAGLGLSILLAAWCLAALPSRAAVVNFETTTPQSMWGTGNAAIFDASVFIGAEWSTPKAELGNIIGDVVTIPGVDPILVTPAIPRKLITPAVPRKLLVPAKRVCLFGKCVTTPAVYSPAIPAVYSPAIPAVYTPAIPPTVIDTRTGATIGVSTTGKIGLQQTLQADGGSINAQVKYDVDLAAPDKVEALKLFNLNQGATLLADSTFATNFPQVKAKTEFILGVKAEIDAEACLIGTGCIDGSTTIGFDPVALELISFNEDNNGRIRLLGIDALGPAGFNFGDPISFKGPTGAEVGNFTIHVPNLVTNGVVNDGVVGANGEADFLEVKLDLDGIAQTAAGLPPVLGAGLDIEVVPGLSLNLGYDLLDIEFGPIFEVLQSFELEPTLMVDLAFTAPVFVEGFDDPQTFLSVPVAELPRIALDTNQTVDVTPTYWLDASLMNTTQLGVDGEFTLDVLKASFAIEALGLSLDLGSLGPLFAIQERFDVADLPPLFDKKFALQGFAPVVGDTFTLSTVTAQPSNEPVALENALAVLVTGSPVELSQQVDKPTDPTFDFGFDYLFVTDEGVLNVYLNDILITMIESPGAMSDFAFFNATLNTDDYFGLGDTTAGLRFLFDGPSGSTLLIDNVEYPGILNGNFDLGSITGRLTHWQTQTQNEFGVVQVVVFDADPVPEPAPAALSLLALLGLAAATRRRRAA